MNLRKTNWYPDTSGKNQFITLAVCIMLLLPSLLEGLGMGFLFAQCPTVGFYANSQSNSVITLPATMACNAPWIELNPNKIWSAASHKYITPGIQVHIALSNSRTGNNVIFAQGGQGVWGTETITPNMIYDIWVWGLSPSQTQTVSFCETLTSSANMTYTITDVSNGAVLATGTWNTADGKCDSVVIPKNTIKGLASYSGSTGLFYSPNTDPYINGDDGYALFDPALAGPGTHNITYSWNNQNGCSGTSTKTITVTNPYTATITPVGNLCITSAPVTLTAVSNGGTWSGKGVSGNSFNPAVAGVGTHTITYVVGKGTCSVTATITITVKPNPVASAGTDTAICKGDSITLNASGGISYSWTPTMGLSNAKINNPKVISSVSTSYVVTVTDANNCSAKDSVFVTVNNPPSASTSADTTICKGDSILLSATGGTSYQWNTGDTTSSVKVSPSNTVSYRVTVSQNNCSVKDSVQITVIPKPTVNVGNDLTLCLGDSIQLTTTASNDVITYFWLLAKGLSNTGILNPILKPDTSSLYILEVSNGNCKERDSIFVKITNPPVAGFTTVAEESSLTISFNNTSTGAINYEWSFGDSSIISATTPVHTYPGYGKYNVQLIAYSIDNCTDTILKPINIKGESALWIPTVFTPNKDGKNELFSVGSLNMKEFKADVFNRWGQHLYQWNDVDGGWDGTFKGRICPDGVYVYIIRAKGIENRVYDTKGFFTLIR